VDAADLYDICVAFGDRAGILVGTAEGRAVTALLFLTFGARAFLMLPATGPEGRRIGAGYAMHARLFDELRRRGMASVDMGGLDPRSRMHDVDRFKVGFGAGVVEYVGEWEWASASWLRWLVNGGVFLRRSMA
jgi:lipid II:glycine glycyltransferase (peptidoglycan interpeptide bridge formation enzyme)